MTNNLIDLSTQIEGDLIAMLDEFHSLPEVWDNELDTQIAKWYSNPPKVWPKRDHPYFSPSGATKCPRELYYKSKRAKKDGNPIAPHQRRWQILGTGIGDMVQREILSIERNFEKNTGNKPRFRFEKNDDGTPVFEEFSGMNKLIEHSGEKFYLYGFCDGIMEYLTDDGEIIRVGLEIKSKQQNPGATSVNSMKQAGFSHEAQAELYALMYDVDYYVILYYNASKRAWDMSEEEYRNFPDIRAFCRKVTPANYGHHLDKFADITRALRENKPPKLDPMGWRFNDYKMAIAQELSEEEFDDIQKQAERIRHSSASSFVKNSYATAVNEIEELREKGANNCVS